MRQGQASHFPFQHGHDPRSGTGAKCGHGEWPAIAKRRIPEGKACREIAVRLEGT